MEQKCRRKLWWTTM